MFTWRTKRARRGRIEDEFGPSGSHREHSAGTSQGLAVSARSAPVLRLTPAAWPDFHLAVVRQRESRGPPRHERAGRCGDGRTFVWRESDQDVRLHHWLTVARWQFGHVECPLSSPYRAGRGARPSPARCATEPWPAARRTRPGESPGTSPCDQGWSGRSRR